MKRSMQLVNNAFIVAFASALGACATTTPADKSSLEAQAERQSDYTYCVSNADDPQCGGQQAAAPAPTAAAAPAPTPVPEQPKERTVVVAEAGPPPNKAGECYTKVVLPAEFRDEPVQEMVQA